MHNKSSIKKVSEFILKNRLILPETPGVYAFWWLGNKDKLLEANRKVLLVGPNKKLVEVEYLDWWPKNLTYPCLYVGKTTNLKKRFSQHIKRGCKSRLHEIPKNNHKKNVKTTSCQLRYGIEHVFKTESDPLLLINEEVGFSYMTNFDTNAIAERFFTEDKLIGKWRPWFNVDSER